MTEEKEFNSEHLKVKLTELPDCIVKIEVLVAPQATQAAYVKAIKNIGKEVSVRGFRKGKAPEEMIVQRFHPQIEEEFRSIVVNTAIHEAFALADRFPYHEKAVSKVHVDNCSRLEGAKVTAEYESFPKVPSVNPSELHIEKIEIPPIQEQEISDEINQLVYRFAEWNDVVDRGVEEGDYIDLDIVAIEDQTEQSICEDTRFFVAKGRMGDWMHKLVLGMQIGQNAEGMSEKEDNNASSEPFVPKLCRLTLKGIKTAKLPEVNDEFASKFGIKTVAELQENIQKLIISRKQRETQEKSQALVEKALLEKYLFDLPGSLVRAECKPRLEANLHALEHHQKLSAQEIADRKRSIEMDVTSHVKNFLRLEFLIYKLIREKNIEVTQEEVYKEYLNQIMLQPQERLFDLEKDKERVPAILKRVILFKKALDYILSHSS